MAKNLLYHYCSTNTFREIVSNHKLWLSDALCMNDYSEVMYMKLFAEKFLNSLKDPKEKSFLNEALERFNKKFLVPTYFYNSDSKVQKKISHQIDNKFRFYIFCMSEKGDLLSQWRAYAEDAKGFSIGFSKKVFSSYIGKGKSDLPSNSNLVISKLSKGFGLSIDSVEDFMKDNQWGKHKIDDFWFDSFLCLSKIIYSEEEQKEHIRKISDYWWKENQNDNALTSFSIDLYKNAIILKNSGFKEEKEHRLVYVEPPLDNKLKIHEFYELKNQMELTFKPRFRSTPERLIPYHVLDFSNVKDFIQEIYIGPKNKTNEEDLMRFLELNKITAEIKYSSASYR